MKMNEDAVTRGLVVSLSRDVWMVSVDGAVFPAELSGRFRHTASGGKDYPAVGDLVLLDRTDGDAGHGQILGIEPRKSAFVRRAAGTGHEIQVVAANIDTVFLCMSLNRDYNLRRLERYLAVAWDSGALPVVILTKADLAGDTGERLEEVASVAPGVEVILTSSLEGLGIGELDRYLQPGKTVAFLGSSGVGKSTLINTLMGSQVLETGDIREDGRGRHTTTRRELLFLPGGARVIDTPGMRELGLESADTKKAFGEISLLAGQCRFRDCTHTGEPGCAVLAAVEDGVFSRSRLDSYLKLRREAGYEGKNSRQIEKEKTDAMFAEFGSRKNARDYIKGRNRRRGGSGEEE